MGWPIMDIVIGDLSAFIALLWPACVPVLGGVLALAVILSLIAPFRALAERG